MSEVITFEDQSDMACERIMRLIQEALDQRSRHYQAIFPLSIYFEGDQTGAAEDSKIFLDMVRSFGAEGEALRIPVSSPRPGWNVRDQITALIKQGLQLSPENGRVLLLFHYAGHGSIGDNGWVFNADSKYPRTFNYDRTINPKLETFSDLDDYASLGETFDCVTILDSCHSSYATRDGNLQTRRAEVVSSVREDQTTFTKGIDHTGKVTTRSFTARIAGLVSRRRGKGHESISFLDVVEELKTKSHPTRMPQFKMLFGSTAAIRVPLLLPSSAVVHGQSANLSSATLKQGDVIRTVFSVHMPRDIDSEGVEKLTDWLLKLDRQFGLHVSGVYPGNSTFLLIEAPISTWASLEGLPSFKHVFEISGPNAISHFQSTAGQSYNKASELDSPENVGLKERPASSQNKSDSSKVERKTKSIATSGSSRPENTIPKPKRWQVLPRRESVGAITFV